MKKEQVLAKLRSCGLVAVVRAKDADDAMRSEKHKSPPTPSRGGRAFFGTRRGGALRGE